MANATRILTSNTINGSESAERVYNVEAVDALLGKKITSPSPTLGTAGQVLTVNAGATGLTWSNGSGGSANPTFISNYTVNDYRHLVRIAVTSNANSNNFNGLMNIYSKANNSPTHLVGTLYIAIPNVFNTYNIDAKWAGVVNPGTTNSAELYYVLNGGTGTAVTSIDIYLKRVPSGSVYAATVEVLANSVGAGDVSIPATRPGAPTSPVLIPQVSGGGGVTLPSNSAGFLGNDGNGALSWETITAGKLFPTEISSWSQWETLPLITQGQYGKYMSLGNARSAIVGGALGFGSSGQVLATNSNANGYTWITPSGGGSAFWNGTNTSGEISSTPGNYSGSWTTDSANNFPGGWGSRVVLASDTGTNYRQHLFITESTNPPRMFFRNTNAMWRELIGVTSKGTANQYLKMNSAGTDFEWGTPSGGGGVTYPLSLANGGTGRNNLDNNSNLGIGNTALEAITDGASNTAIGHFSLRRITTGAHNTAIGRTSLNNITTSGFNTAVGEFAGTYLGSNDDFLTSVTNSIFIGYRTTGGGNNRTNQIVIGYDAVGRGSNTITLGNDTILSSGGLFCRSTAITGFSDTRLKEDIKSANLDMCLETVKNLPVSRYKYKDFMGEYVDTHMTGFLADDVEKVFPKSVCKLDQYYPILDEDGKQIYEEIEEDTEDIDENGEKIIKKQVRKIEKTFFMKDVKAITMTEAVPTLWGAVQQLIKIIEEKDSLIQNLAKRVEVLETVKSSKRKPKTIIDAST